MTVKLKLKLLCMEKRSGYHRIKYQACLKEINQLQLADHRRGGNNCLIHKAFQDFSTGGNTIEMVDWNLRPTFPFTMHLALMLLSTLCLITGLFAQQVIQFIGSALMGKEQIIFGNTFFYTAENLTKTFWTVASGIVLFFLAISKPGKRVLSVLKQLKGGFSDLFLGFAVALSALMGYLLLVWVSRTVLHFPVQ